jgi:hypothetical protein
LQMVATRYLRGNFMFDLLTSIPGSLVESIMMQASKLSET